MSVPTSPSLVASLSHPLDTALVGRQEEKRDVGTRPAPALAPDQAEPQSGPNFKEVVRANLHAAAQHTTLGHEAPSFRECSHPSCRNASNLIPYPVAVEVTVTEADIEEIFQRIVPATLEEVVSSPRPVRTASEWPDQPAFIA